VSFVPFLFNNDCLQNEVLIFNVYVKKKSNKLNNQA